MSDPQITSEEWQVRRIGLGRGYGEPGNIYGDGSNVSRNDDRSGFFFCTDAELILNDNPVDLWELLKWFCTAGKVQATVWRDQSRYGHVVKVEFRG